MKFSAVVLLLLIYLESHFQYFAQVQNLAPDLTPQEPSGNPAEFPNNTHPSRKNNKSSSENPKNGSRSPIQDDIKMGLGLISYNPKENWFLLDRMPSLSNWALVQNPK